MDGWMDGNCSAPKINMKKEAGGTRPPRGDAMLTSQQNFKATSRHPRELILRGNIVLIK